MSMQRLGFEDLYERLQSIEDLTSVSAALQAGGLTLMDHMAIYPTQKSVKRSEAYGKTWQSEKQRRYVMGAIRRGEITVPYRRGQDARSERFDAAWTMRTQGALTVIIGNDSTYGPHLKDPAQQSAMARLIGWKTVDDDLNDMQDPILDSVSDTINAALHKE